MISGPRTHPVAWVAGPVPSKKPSLGRAHDHHPVQRPRRNNAPECAGGCARPADRRRDPGVGGRGHPEPGRAHTARAHRPLPGGHGAAAPRGRFASRSDGRPGEPPGADGQRLVPRPERRAVSEGALHARRRPAGLPRVRRIRSRRRGGAAHGRPRGRPGTAHGWTAAGRRVLARRARPPRRQHRRGPGTRQPRLRGGDGRSHGRRVQRVP